MFNPLFFQPTWADYILMGSHPNEANPHGLDMVANLGNLEFSASLATMEGYSDISSSIPYFLPVFSEEFPFENTPMPTCSDDAHAVSALEEYPLSPGELDHMWNDELFDGNIEDVCGRIGEKWEGIFLQNHSLNEEESLISSGVSSFGTLSPNEMDHLCNDELFDSNIEDVCGRIGLNCEGTLSQNHSLNDEESMISSGDLSLGESWEGIPLQNHSLNEEESMISSGDLSFGTAEEGMEVDNEVSIFHLLKAYCEAVRMGSIELGEVISQRISKKVSPVGATMERLGHYLFQGIDNQTDYLKQESSKNYDKTLQAFYEICPYGRFAHFVANMAILEAVPKDVQTVHIVDFDMGEGVQWPPLLESLGRHRMVRLTSIIRREEKLNDLQLKFKSTKRHICDYARSQGLQLMVEEMDMNELLIEKRRMKKRGGGKEWMAFNCMVSLPHMQMERSRKHAIDFVRVAKELINTSNSNSSDTRNRGIITFGSGHGVEMRKGKDCGFGSFFDGCLAHSHALFKSMEWHFPPHLSLARTAVECLFVGPYVSSLECFRKWEETHEACDMHLGVELEGWRLSQENLVEAKEMVRGESLYEVRIAERENEMVLEWKGTPLVRVSVWR